ncbi:MAG: riboflavin synthase [Candidatus Rokubacteria bacterium]|nr:riboflavin synthase [Candidatus Rokubacteria bacterium]
MFTGIVEEMGLVRRLERGARTATLEVGAHMTLEGSEVGASVAVNGVCLTVVSRCAEGFAFEVGPETLERTALGRLAAGDAVNLERPLRFGGALGGHLVLGHVDGVGTVEHVSRVESTARVRIALLQPELEPLLIPQGSAAVEGVSLTVAALGPKWFEVMLIPHTLAVTTLGRLVAGQPVNIEADVIGKYVLRSLSLSGYGQPPGRWGRDLTTDPSSQLGGGARGRGSARGALPPSDDTIGGGAPPQHTGDGAA